MIMLSISISCSFPSSNPWINIAIKTLETAGLSVLIAAIFSFAAGTNDFIEKVASLLKSIIIDRTFLGNISAEQKRDALKTLLRPSNKEQLIYSNLEYYYESQVEQTLSVSKKCVRSNYNFQTTATKDELSQRIKLTHRTRYRLYPTIEGYEKIKVGFMHYSDNAKPVCKSLKVNFPTGDGATYPDLELKEQTHDGERVLLGEVDLSPFSAAHAHLDIEINSFEFGSIDFATIAFTALQPTDGFTFDLHCEDDIKIRDCISFMTGSFAKIDRQKTEKLSISCSKWLNDGAGLCVSIGYMKSNGGTVETAKK